MPLVQLVALDAAKGLPELVFLDPELPDQLEPLDACFLLRLTFCRVGRILARLHCARRHLKPGIRVIAVPEDQQLSVPHDVADHLPDARQLHG